MTATDLIVFLAVLAVALAALLTMALLILEGADRECRKARAAHAAVVRRLRVVEAERNSYVEFFHRNQNVAQAMEDADRFRANVVQLHADLDAWGRGETR